MEHAMKATNRTGKQRGIYFEIEQKENRNIRNYLISKSISLLGTNIYNFALSLYILKVTGSGSSFAINILAGMLPRLLLGPFAGVLADRVNRKKLTILFDLISGFTVFVLLGLSLFNGLHVTYIYITGFLLSSINTFYDTSLTAALPNLVRDEKLMKINSYSSTANALSGVLSPVLAGMVFGVFSINVFLVINGLSFIISSLLEFGMDFDVNISDVVKKDKINLSSLRTEMKEVLNFCRQQKMLYSLLKYTLMINLFLTASITVIFPYVINKVLKLNSGLFGIFQSFYFVGMIIFSILLSNNKERTVKIKGIAKGIIIIGGIIILMGVPTMGIRVFQCTPIIAVYNCILLFVMGAILVTINTPMLVTIQRLTPEALRGRLTGFLSTLTSGITPLGIILAGILIDKIPPFILLIISGVWIIFSGMRMAKNKKFEINLD